MKDYYEILQCSTQATPEELKKQYRKLALQYHPDKNPDNIEEATRQFRILQEAYEILSDPQERAWYDSHKHQESTRKDEIYEKPAHYQTDVLFYFTNSCYSSMDDSETGFYKVYRELFQKLKNEEIQEFHMFQLEEISLSRLQGIPEFGNMNSQYDEVKQFYDFWLDFVSHKQFLFMNQYRYSEAENRRIKRLMEKENKKLRDQAKKEFHENVRALVRLVQKRDLRWKKLVEEKKRALEMKRILEKRKMKEKKLAEQQQGQFFEEQDWMKVEAKFDEVDDDEEEVLEELFCVCCDKAFKSEQQFFNHQSSKKHKRNLEDLKMKMAEEDLLIFQDSETEEEEEEVFGEKHGGSYEDNGNDIFEDDIIDNNEIIQEEQLEQDKIDQNASDPIYRDPLKDLEKDEKSDSEKLNETIEKLSINEKSNLKKKKEKKKKQKEKSSTELICKFCQSEFESRNKLFQHIKITGHALAPDIDQTSLTAEPFEKEKKKKQKEKSSNEQLICNVCQSEFESRNKLFQHIKSTGHALAQDTFEKKKKKKK